MDEGEAPPDYSMITMENFETNGASANTSNTLVHMDTRQIMDNSQQDNNNYSTLSNNTGVATVTNQNAYEHVKDSHDPDYFDDLHVLQQIRAHKQWHMPCICVQQNTAAVPSHGRLYTQRMEYAYMHKTYYVCNITFHIQVAQYCFRNTYYANKHCTHVVVLYVWTYVKTTMMFLIIQDD